MFRASYFNVYINQRDAQILVNNIYFFSLNGSTYFGLSLVHHQEQHLISCTVQLVHAGKSGCCMDICIQQPDLPACTNCAVQLIKCCSWWWNNDSPKHVEPFNEKIKIIHKNLCISLVYIHIEIQQPFLEFVHDQFLPYKFQLTIR